MMTTEANVSGESPHATPEDKSKRQASAWTLVLGSAWLVGMTLWYVVTAVSSIRSSLFRIPLWDDRRWQIALAAVVLSVLALGAVIALQFIFRRLPIATTCMILIGLAGISCVLIRQQVRALVIVLWILTVSYASGKWLLDKAGGVQSPASGERVTVSLGVGLVVLSILCFLLGMIGWLRPGMILGGLTLLTVLQLRALRTLASGIWQWVGNWRSQLLDQPGPPERRVLALLLSLIALNNLTWTLSPEISFDALNYQLAVPRLYLENGAMIDLHYFWHSYFARLFNSIFLVAMALGGQIAAKLMVFSTGIIAASGVYLLARDLLSRSAGFWAVAIFYSTPLVSWLSTVTYVDMPISMFVVTSWLAFLQWLKGGERGWLIGSGILAGAVIGAKPNGAFALPVLGAVLLWVTVRRRLSFARVNDLLAFVAVAAVVALPWYWLSWRFTGNPVFPLFNGIFKSPYWEITNRLMNAADFGVGRSFWSLLRVPFALTFQSRIFDEVMPSGGVGLALVLLPLAFLCSVIARRRARLLLAACVVFLLLWALTFQYARYYIPILPIVVALSVTGVVGWAASGWPRRLGVTMLWVILISQGLLNSLAFGNIVSRNPLLLMFGRLSEQQYLAKALNSYRAAEYLNGVTQPGDWVIGAGVESVRYYVRAPIISIGETLALQKLVIATKEEHLPEAFDKLGYRYLFVNRADPAGNMIRLKYLRPSFLDRFATLEYRYNSAEVYRLHPKEVETRESLATNLLRNAGFEGPDGVGGFDGWIANGKTGALREGSPPVHGGRAACVDEGAVTQRVAVTAGSTYTLSSYARTDPTGHEVQTRLKISWFGKDGTRLDTSFEDLTIGSEWRWLQMTISAPSDAVSAEIALAFAGASVCFDDVWFGAGVKRRPE